MKRGKRIVSLLLALVMSVGMFTGLATTAFAATEEMTLYTVTSQAPYEGENRGSLCLAVMRCFFAARLRLHTMLESPFPA